MKEQGTQIITDPRYWTNFSKSRTLAPESYRNWLAFNDHREFHGSNEFALLADSLITGQWDRDLGPFAIFNPSPPGDNADESQIRLILKMDRYLAPSPFDPRHEDQISEEYCTAVKTVSGVDEIVALLSLCLGVPLWNGGCIREYNPSGYPTEGCPRAFDIQAIRTRPRCRRTRRMIPSTTVAAVNNEIPHLLLTYAELTPTDAAALVRSSTLYQDALWYSDIMPDLSWLMLVQSVETLAQAAKTDCDDYEWIWEADGRKSLKLFLSDRGMSADDIAHVATILAPDCGATRNFRSFMLEHFATEPSIRPCRAMQVEWSTSRWRIILNGLYGLRSKAVHEGRRFPDELCIPPGEDQKGVYAEYPPPYNGTPKSVHLHVFSDFTRQVLLNWWRSKSSDDQIVVLKGC